VRKGPSKRFRNEGIPNSRENNLEQELGNVKGAKSVNKALELGLWQIVRARRATAYKTDYANYEPEGREFESLRARHFSRIFMTVRILLFEVLEMSRASVVMGRGRSGLPNLDRHWGRK
jgi:hypothetical protein